MISYDRCDAQFVRRRDRRCQRTAANRRSIGLMLMLLTLVGASCDRATPDAIDRDTTASTASSLDVHLTGAGATFPYPLYARWFNEYAQHSGVRINYLSVGSGNGIDQLIAGEVDFGAADVPMTNDELARARHPIVHIPTMIGAVAITYNLPELSRPLNLSGDVIADIFLGRITRWNDARIAVSNPSVALPARDVLVVHRADHSGTSQIFSNYLASVSGRWQQIANSGRNISWPVGTGGHGNEGIAGQVKQVPGSIGYVEVVYARQNRLPTVHVRNRAGRFVSPLPYEVANAAAAVTDTLATDSDLRVSLVNAPGAQSYPIASFSWILVSPEAIGPTRTRQLVDFLRWAFSDGDQIVSTMGYVALPQETTKRIMARLDAIVVPE